MADFRDVTQGPRYYGPEDETLLNHITMFGTRDSCSYNELNSQFGVERNVKIKRQLERLCKEGKIEPFIKDWQVFIKRV